MTYNNAWLFIEIISCINQPYNNWFFINPNSVLGKLNPDLDPLPAAAITTDILFESFIFHVVSKAMQNTIKKANWRWPKKSAIKLKAISS